MSDVAYIALDPGGTTGYATFEENGTLIDMTYYNLETIRTSFLEDFQPVLIAVICENWRLMPQIAKHFYHSDMPTCKLIGWLEGTCDTMAIQFHLQEPAIKSSAYKWAGKTPLPKSNPMNHAMDAYVHGYYWLMKNGVIVPK